MVVPYGTVVQILASTIDSGWPEKVEDVDSCIKLYFDVRDTLTRCDGVILKGERVAILFVCGVSLTSAQLINELFPDWRVAIPEA